MKVSIVNKDDVIQMITDGKKIFALSTESMEKYRFRHGKQERYGIDRVFLNRCETMTITDVINYIKKDSCFFEINMEGENK